MRGLKIDDKLLSSRLLPLGSRRAAGSAACLHAVPSNLLTVSLFQWKKLFLKFSFFIFTSPHHKQFSNTIQTTQCCAVRLRNKEETGVHSNTAEGTSRPSVTPSRKTFSKARQCRYIHFAKHLHHIQMPGFTVFQHTLSNFPPLDV